MSELTVEQHSQKNSAEEAFLQERLAAFNLDLTGPTERRDLTITFKDSQGQIVAGMNGSTNWGWLYTRLLWVDESHQKQGLGRRLMQAAESEALNRGCHAAWIDTFSAKAKDFYLALGYRVFGELPQFVGKNTRYFLSKDLR